MRAYTYEHINTNMYIHTCICMFNTCMIHTDTHACIAYINTSCIQTNTRIMCRSYILACIRYVIIYTYIHARQEHGSPEGLRGSRRSASRRTHGLAARGRIIPPDKRSDGQRWSTCTVRVICSKFRAHQPNDFFLKNAAAW
jgi:hypothetical protein